MEEWRDIKGYEGRYQISSLGRVKSLKNNHGNYREKLLSLRKDKNGYLTLKLYKNGKGKLFKVHRLVAEAFISNPNSYPQVNHKDENKINNCISNLEWCTSKYNNNYGTRNKRASESRKGISMNKGSKHPMYGKHHTEEAKKKISQNHADFSGSKNPNSGRVLCVTTNKEFDCIKEAGEDYKLTPSQIRHITICCKGKIKSAGKHPVTGEKLVWKYID